MLSFFVSFSLLIRFFLQKLNLIQKEVADESSVDSDAMQAQQSTPTQNDANEVVNVEDEDAQAAFLNHCIEQERIDFERSAQSKRAATVIGKHWF